MSIAKLRFICVFNVIPLQFTASKATFQQTQVRCTLPFQLFRFSRVWFVLSSVCSADNPVPVCKRLGKSGRNKLYH